MKRILLILLPFIIGGMVNAQQGIKFKEINTGTTVLNLGAFPFDTTRVIMLCADTAYKYPNPTCFWEIGYEVTDHKVVGHHTEDEHGNNWSGSILIVGMKYFTVPEYKNVHVSYLDNNMKPLPPSVIVWQSKDISPLLTITITQ